MASKDPLIYLSVGDDGGGPWAFARGLAGGLAQQLQTSNRSAKFIIDGRDNQRGVKGITDRVQQANGQIVNVRTRDQLLWLPRTPQTNFVDPSRLEHDVLTPFQTNFNQYSAAVGKDISKVDLVIAIVDPCAIAAAKQHAKKAVEVTDHTWDVTMRLVLDQVSGLNTQVLNTLDYISSLYGFADRLYLWSEPITPGDPFGLEAQLLGVDTRHLKGVIEKPNMPPPYVKNYYQIDNDLPTVGVSTGAQGALAEIMQAASNSYLKQPPQEYNVVIHFNRPQVFRSNVPYAITLPSALPVAELGSICEVLITAGGGGTINSAIASRVPWVTVLETFQPQIKAIARSAQQMGLTRCVPYRTVLSDPRAFIENELFSPLRQAARQTIRGQLNQYSQQAELRWADEVIQDFIP